MLFDSWCYQCWKQKCLIGKLGDVGGDRGEVTMFMLKLGLEPKRSEVRLWARIFRKAGSYYLLLYDTVCVQVGTCM